MKIVVFNDKNMLDIAHETMYFAADALEHIENTLDMIRDFKPDLFIEEEKNDGVSHFTEIYRKLPGIPKAWWLIDGHCNLIDHVVYAKQFDYVFCAQSWFVPIIQREVLNKVFWLPLCHTQTLTEYQEMMQEPVQRDIEFSFIGNLRSIHVERQKYVRRFLEIYPDFFARQADYQDMLTYLRRSKATFNCSLNNDLNFRVWEAIACGTAVVTDYVTDTYNIKGLSKYVVLYDKLVPDWSNLGLPDKINSQEFIESGHTLTHRMNQLLGMIDSNTQYEY